MNMPPIPMVVIGMVMVWPAFVLPVIAGVVIPRLFRDDPIRGLVGWFTLKPLIATPLWLVIIGLGNRLTGWVLLFSLLPGIGLTVYLVYKFRRLFSTEKNIFYILLAGDALRWLNAFGFLLASGGTWAALSEEIPHWIGMILPNAYALMALGILWLRRRSRETGG